jgi:hypothetical protein
MSKVKIFVPSTSELMRFYSSNFLNVFIRILEKVVKKQIDMLQSNRYLGDVCCHGDITGV